MKKNRQKDFKKIKIIRICTIIFLSVLLFFFSTAYSVLNQNLKIEGEIIVPKKENASLTASFKRKQWGLFSCKFNLIIKNNNSYPISNWVATINCDRATSVTSASTNLKTTLNTSTDIITVTAEKGKTDGIIQPGETKTFEITISSFFNLDSSYNATAITEIDPEYLELSKYSAKYVSRASVNEINQYYNSSKLSDTTGYKLKNFVKEFDKIAIAVEYDINEYSGKFVTNAKLKIINPQNEKIKKLDFSIRYNENLSTYQQILCTDLNQVKSTEKKSIYSLKEYDEILPKTVQYYNINNFITLDEFKSFEIDIINLEFEKSKETLDNKIDNIEETNKKTVIEDKTSENIRNNNIDKSINEITNNIINDNQVEYTEKDENN